MTATIKDFNSDFTRFLDGKVRHTVKIVTKSEIIECSGVILSQHSEVMKRMIEDDEEIFLDNYNFVRECLVILHGGTVELTEENCEEIIKFGIQFCLVKVIEQGLEFLASVVIVESVKNSAKICWSAKRFAAFCDFNVNVDYFWPLEDIVNMLAKTELDQFVADINSLLGIGAVLEMITNKVLAKKLLNNLTYLIDQSNVDDIVGKFPTVQEYDYYNAYVEAFSDCPKRNVLQFLEKIEESELLSKQWKIFKHMKKSVLRESITREFNFKLDEKELLKPWKQFSEEKILHVCKVLKTNFYVMEVIMSWVALKRPDLKTVRHLCYLVDTDKLTKEYLEHAENVLKSEGYTVSFNANGGRSNQFDIFKNPLTIISNANRNIVHRTLSKMSYETKLFINLLRKDKLPTEPIDITIDATAKHGNRINSNGRRVRTLFGRTMEGKQIPFYTDIHRAVQEDMVYDANTLCAYFTYENKGIFSGLFKER